MYLIIKNRIVEKAKIFAFLSFMAGLVFLLGLMIYIFSFFSFITLVEQMSKITAQMNLLAFFVASLYLFKPNHRFFTKNLLAVFSTIMLCFVGLGFWLILFPLYYIDLGHLLIHTREMQWHNFALFFGIWNHTVTPIIFLLFFFHLSKKSNLYYLTNVNIKSIFMVLAVYSIVWIITNVMISFMGGIFPTYGILTNFNPYTEFNEGISDGESLFSVKYLIASHIACFLLSFILTLFFSSMSIKFGISNHYKLTNKILRGATKSLKGFS